MHGEVNYGYSSNRAEIRRSARMRTLDDLQRKARKYKVHLPSAQLQPILWQCQQEISTGCIRDDGVLSDRPHYAFSKINRLIVAYLPAGASHEELLRSAMTHYKQRLLRELNFSQDRAIERRIRWAVAPLASPIHWLRLPLLLAIGTPARAT